MLLKGKRAVEILMTLAVIGIFAAIWFGRDIFFAEEAGSTPDLIIGITMILVGLSIVVYHWVEIYPELEITKVYSKLGWSILETLGSGPGGVGVVFLSIGILLCMNWAGFDFESLT